MYFRIIDRSPYFHFFSKILEKLMHKRLTDYGILTDRQYGFRSKSSTNHAMIELVDKITKAIENNEFTVGIFLDLLVSKAFDTENHNVLLNKLYFYRWYWRQMSCLDQRLSLIIIITIFY